MKTKYNEAICLAPIIESVQSSLDRFRAVYHRALKGYNVDIEAAVVDLTINVEDLEDAVEKNAEAK